MTEEMGEDKKFETWISIYPDVLDTYNGMDKRCREAMRWIVIEMFRHGFKVEDWVHNPHKESFVDKVNTL